jgi:hypothetical protein
MGSYRFDIFPERPGDEFVVVYSHEKWSSRLIRIVDFSGEVLFESWHDGDVYDVAWMSGPGLLWVVGRDAGPYWDDEGNSLADLKDPPVLFALRPEVGLKERDAFVLDRPTQVSGGLSPVCTQWLAADAQGNIDQVQRMNLLRSTAPHDPSDTLRLDVRLRTGDDSAALMWWYFDPSGSEISDTRDCDDAYKRNLAAAARGETVDPLPKTSTFKTTDTRPTPP